MRAMSVTRPPTILLAEDNPDHAELIRRGLAEAAPGVSLAVVSDGEEAIEFLFGRGRHAASHSGSVRLVLLDLRLPRLDGLEVLRRIKEADHLRGVPVVILTTSEAETDLSRAYRHHANSYLVKPVDFDRFVELIRALEQYWVEWNRQPREGATLTTP